MNQLIVLRIQLANPFHQLMNAFQPHRTAFTIAFQIQGAAARIQFSTGPILRRFWASAAPLTASGAAEEASAGADGSVTADEPCATTDTDAGEAETAAGPEATRTAAGADARIAPASATATPLFFQLKPERLLTWLMQFPLFSCVHLEHSALNINRRNNLSQMSLVNRLSGNPVLSVLLIFGKLTLISPVLSDSLHEQQS